MNVHERLRRVVHGIVDLFEADAVVLLLPCDEPGRLVLARAHGLDAGTAPSVRVARDDDPAARATHTGETAVLDDLTDDGGPILHGAGIRSLMASPVRVRAGAGVLYVGSRERAAFRKRDARILSLLAESVATALDACRSSGHGRELDKLRERVEAAERAVRARDDLLAYVSHDLRNPLSAILVNTLLIRREASPGDRGARLRHQVEGIRRCADRMNQLVSDLLDRDCLDAGRLPMSVGPHPVGVLVEKACDLLGPLAEQKKIQLVSTGITEGLVVSCDGSRILQVLENLIGNAISFTPEGGAVSVRVARRDAQVGIEVSDTGKGIASEQLAHVFERYWRGGVAPGKGRGLGLAIAKRIVELHGGYIWAISRPGEGSTFAFTLPATEVVARRALGGAVGSA